MQQARSVARRTRLTAFLSVFVLALAALLLGLPAKADPNASPKRVATATADPAQELLPALVVAKYRVSFGLLGDIGHFAFRSDLEGEAYTLAANAKIDTAVFDYRGKMSSSGLVRAADAKPARHKFSWRQKAFLGKKKKKSLSIAFNGAGATKVDFVPHQDRSKKKGIVKVRPEHLENVLDPLSGILALSIGDFDRPCDRRLPIFDGKQRFDLVFSQRRRTQGRAAPAVCHVRLIAISGHKKGEGADSIINGDIEVVLQPVPKANILVPYRVTVPTILGSAVLASEEVDITMPDRQRIALRR